MVSQHKFPKKSEKHRTQTPINYWEQTPTKTKQQMTFIIVNTEQTPTKTKQQMTQTFIIVNTEQTPTKTEMWKIMNLLYICRMICINCYKCFLYFKILKLSYRMVLLELCLIVGTLNYLCKKIWRYKIGNQKP
jgi:hypothetical protein